MDSPMLIIICHVFLFVSSVFSQDFVIVDDFRDSDGWVDASDNFEINGAGGTILSPNALDLFKTGSPTSMIGGERDMWIAAVQVNPLETDGSVSLLIQNVAQVSTDTNTLSSVEIVWDGVDNSPNIDTSVIADWSYPSSICRTSTPGFTPQFRLFFDSYDACNDHTVTLYSNGGVAYSQTILIGIIITQCFVVKPRHFDIPITDFVGVDLSQIEAVKVTYDGIGDNQDNLDYIYDFVGVCCCTDNSHCDDLNPNTIDTCVAYAKPGTKNTQLCHCNHLLLTDAPTDAPTQPPTDPPTASPTESPTDPPTDPPTDTPTEAPGGSLGDYVWHDINRNGLQDDGPTDGNGGYINTGFAGVSIRVVEEIGGKDCTENGADSEYGVQFTNANGGYLFELVPSGDYLVQVTDTNNVLGTYLATTVVEYCVTLPASTDILTLDFGYVNSATIGDLVWYDDNYDGVPNLGQPEEYGIVNVVIEIYQDLDNDCEIDVGELLGTETTDSDGLYLFTMLEPGYRYIVQQTDPASVLSIPNQHWRTTFHNPFCVYLGPGDSYLDADWGFVLFDCPPLCEEEGKAEICLYDQDGAPNRICVVMAELPDVLSNGGFIPGTQQHDCQCQPITGVPTPEVTFGPTTEPTAEPTIIPTAEPTGEPTVPPTTAPTTDPTQTPTMPPTDDPTSTPTAEPTYEICDPNGTPDQIDRCVMGPNYEITFQSVPDNPEVPQPGNTHIPIGSTFTILDQDIYFECDCAAECPEDMVQNLLEDLSSYSTANDLLTLVVAVPTHFEFSQTFFHDGTGPIVGVGSCDDTRNLVPCVETSLASPIMDGNCWDAYTIEVPFSALSPSLPVFDDGALYTFYGVFNIISYVDLGFDRRGDPLFYEEFSSFRFSVSFPKSVEVHLNDIRIYDEVNKFDNLDAVEIYAADFTLGASWAQQVWGELYITTSTQWPFKLELESWDANPDTDIAVSSINPPLPDPLVDCPDPNIAAYGDANWVAAAAANIYADLPMACEQQWAFRIDTTSRCDFDAIYTTDFGVECHPSYGDCPVDDRLDGGIQCVLDLTTGDFCDTFTDTITSTSTLSSYDCSDRTCLCQTDEYIVGDLLTPEVVYFQAVINSTDTLETSQIRQIDYELICQSGATTMIVVYDSQGGDWQAPYTGTIDNCPVIQCGGPDDADHAVAFSLEIDEADFPIDPSDSCNLRVWLSIDLWYADIERPDALTPSGPGCGKKKLKMLLEETDRNRDTDATLGNDAAINRMAVVTHGINIQFPPKEESPLPQQQPAGSSASSHHVHNSKVMMLMLITLHCILAIIFNN